MPGEAQKLTWKELGASLERRRVELDTRYANLTLFSRERGIDYRICWDIEHGARTNYRRPTRTAIEVAYGLEPGWIAGHLAGEADDGGGLYADDPQLRRVWELSEGLPDTTRREMVSLAKAIRDRNGNGNHAERKQA
jgi:hypothetical protein